MSVATQQQSSWGRLTMSLIDLLSVIRRAGESFACSAARRGVVATAHKRSSCKLRNTAQRCGRGDNLQLFIIIRGLDLNGVGKGQKRANGRESWKLDFQETGFVLFDSIQI